MRLLDLIKLNHTPDQTEVLIWRHILGKLPDDKWDEIPLDDNDVVVYNGRFYHLLREKFNIDSKYWLPNLCINDLPSPMDFVNKKTVKIISSEYIDEIISRWENIKNKIL